MFGSAILDIAIGLVFVFLLLSLIVTAVNEFIVSHLGWRATNLYDGISRLLHDAPTEAVWVNKIYDHPLVSSLSTPGEKPSYIPSRTFVLALLDNIARAQSGRPVTIEDVRTGIEGLPEPLKRSLTVLLDEAGHDVERLKTGMEVWFNGSMDRVSGWYKRKSQNLGLVLAALVTIVFNVDTLKVVRTLSNDSALRAALVAQAQEEVKTPTDPAKQDVVQASERLTGLGLPIGWTLKPTKEEQEANRWAYYLSRLCGWALTIFAISLGAPFWFDLLNRFMNIRASGKAPDEAPKEPRVQPQPVAPGTNLTDPPIALVAVPQLAAAVAAPAEAVADPVVEPPADAAAEPADPTVGKKARKDRKS